MRQRVHLLVTAAGLVIAAPLASVALCACHVIRAGLYVWKAVTL